MTHEASLTEAAFREQMEPHRRELLAHCYRMTGSAHDAEDRVQETFVRAWQGFSAFEGRSSLRSWLFKIATNACLDALEKARPRSLPEQAVGPANPADALPAPDLDSHWLTPAPDAWFGDSVPGPEARYSARESIALAFTAALQHLAPRQRAVLLLRDVLGWQASEVAPLLDMTLVAVNSALQRARTTLEARRAGGAMEDSVIRSIDEPTRALLGRYLRAWEEADVPGLVTLLKEDALMAMPPFPTWFKGRHDIGLFLSHLLRNGEARGLFRLRAIDANGGPAFAIYQRDPDTQIFKAASIQVVLPEQGQIASVTSFLSPSLFSLFALPSTWEPGV